jgi:hypothetical protein
MRRNLCVILPKPNVPRSSLNQTVASDKALIRHELFESARARGKRRGRTAMDASV